MMAAFVLKLEGGGGGGGGGEEKKREGEKSFFDG